MLEGGATLPFLDLPLPFHCPSLHFHCLFTAFQVCYVEMGSETRLTQLHGRAAVDLGVHHRNSWKLTNERSDTGASPSNHTANPPATPATDAWLARLSREPHLARLCPPPAGSCGRLTSHRAAAKGAAPPLSLYQSFQQ